MSSSNDNNPAAAAAGNNNNNNNDANESLHQQLLNRLHQAHDSIELDPVQGQFLLDASGGDLDIAVGLYWEDSVAHAARDSNNNNDGHGHGHGNRSNNHNDNHSRNRNRNGHSESKAAAAAGGRKRRNEKGNRGGSSSSQSGSDDSADLNINMSFNVDTNAHANANNDNDNADVDLPFQFMNNNRRSRVHFENDNDDKRVHFNDTDNDPLLQVLTHKGSRRNGSNRKTSGTDGSTSGGASASASIMKKNESKRNSATSDNSTNNGKSQRRSRNQSRSSQINDFIREVSGTSKSASTSTGAGTATSHTNSNVARRNSNASSSSSDNGRNFHNHDNNNDIDIDDHTNRSRHLKDEFTSRCLSAMKQRIKRNSKVASASKSATAAAASSSAGSRRRSNSNPDLYNNHHNNQWGQNNNDESMNQQDDTGAEQGEEAAENLNANANVGDERENQAQGDEQQQPVAAIEEAAESVNVSDDEAAAIAERLWKQIKPKGMKDKAYKSAIQRQIQKMTRKRKKKRMKQSQQESNDDGNDLDIDLDVGESSSGGGGNDNANANASGNVNISGSGSKRKRSQLKTKSSSRNARMDSKSSAEQARRKKGRNNESLHLDNYDGVNASASNDEEYMPSADNSDNESDSDNDNKNKNNNDKKVASSPASQSKKNMNFSEEKGLLLVFDHNKRKRKRLEDEGINEVTGTHQDKDKSENSPISSSKTSSDGNESDFDTVNVDDFEEAFNLSKYDSVTPSQILWGGDQNSDGDNDSETLDSEQPDNAGNADNIDNDDNDNNAEIDVPPENRAGVVIQEEGHKTENKDGVEVISSGDGYDNEEEEEEENSKSSDAGIFDAIIPRTWLSAGFQLSSCGTGLVLPRPVDTELVRLKSIQSVRYSRGTSSMPPPLPPYHCGGITAILSIVTALLYTGASIQGTEVNCNSCQRKPFAELSLEERKMQFPERLADALSSLLFIASRESRKHRLDTLADVEKRLQRKRKKYKNYKLAIINPSDSDEEYELLGKQLPGVDRELMMKQLMQHRAKLCSVCHWEVDNITSELKVPLDRLIDNDHILRFSVTMTNSKDLRSFVWANLRSFMGPGGCALLLETIVHIHGLPRLIRLLGQLRGEVCEGENRSMISCNCEDRVKSSWEEALRKHQQDGLSTGNTKQRNENNAPPGHKCISTELISLIVTGKPEQNTNNWSTSKLGFGLISIDDIGEIGRPEIELQSHSKPIWLVRGESSYSVLWNDELMAKNENIKSVGESLHPFHLSHWNSWYDPAAKKFNGKIIPESVPSPKAVNHKDESKPITKDEIADIVGHPDDQKYYKDFRRWRFCLSKGESSDMTSNRNWISFFRLSKREKKLVEMKMGPQINLAIWSLWPGSDIEWKPSAKLIL